MVNPEDLGTQTSGDKPTKSKKKRPDKNISEYEPEELLQKYFAQIKAHFEPSLEKFKKYTSKK